MVYSSPDINIEKKHLEGKRTMSGSLKKQGFKPYTLKDYAGIRSSKYYELGGLGPSYLGSIEWLKKKEGNEKRLKYGEQVYYINAAKLPLLPISSPKKNQTERDSRQKGLEFAKSIIKPRLKNVSP